MEKKAYIQQINVIHRLCTQRIKKKKKQEMRKADNNVST